MGRILPKIARLGLVAAILAVAGCSTPSERYGLAPPSENAAEYPNINLDPAQKSAQPSMTPAQRAEAQAELERRAGKKAKAGAPAPK